MARTLWLAVVVFVAGTAPARADLPGPWPWSKTPPRPPRYIHTAPAPEQAAEPQTPPAPPNTGTATGGVAVEPPRRNGPARSCGSGAGLGLAGIAAAWGTLWLGNRFAGRVSRGVKTDRGC